MFEPRWASQYATSSAAQRPDRPPHLEHRGLQHGVHEHAGGPRADDAQHVGAFVAVVLAERAVVAPGKREVAGGHDLTAEREAQAPHAVRVGVGDPIGLERVGVHREPHALDDRVVAVV